MTYHQAIAKTAKPFYRLDGTTWEGRIELDPAQVELICEAAGVEGMSAADFMRGAVLARAVELTREVK